MKDFPSEESLGAFAAIVAPVLSVTHTPRDAFRELVVLLIHKPPRETLAAIGAVFDACNWEKPDDWFAWATDGAVTDEKALEWDNLVPDELVGFQRRKSQILNVGAAGPIPHPNKMVPFGPVLKVQH